MATTTGPYPKAIERYPQVRQSLLSTFDDCHLQSLFEGRFGEGWGTHPMNRGTLMHRWVAELLRTMQLHKQTSISKSEAIEILIEVCRQRDVPDEEVVAVPLRERKDMLWVAAKFAKDNAFDVRNLVGIEKRLHATVTYDTPQGPQERILTGQLDALMAEGETGAIVLDWKDTWKLPPEHDPDDMDPGVSYEGYFQQRFYGWLVMKNYPAVQYVTLREFYLRRSTPREATLYRERLHHVEHELSALIEVFDRAVQAGPKSKIWQPSPGKHCGWCLRPGSCPIPDEARGEGAIRSAAQAERYAAQREVGKRIVKHRGDALMAFTHVKGPISVKDAKGRRSVGHVQRTRTRRPTQEEAEAAVARGQDPSTLYKTETYTRFEEFVPEASDRSLQEYDKPLEKALRESAERAKAVKRKTRRKRVNAR